MLVDELYLYAAFAAGWLVGRRWKPHGRWLPTVTLASVLVLVGFLGASFRDTTASELATALPEAVLLVLAVLGATTAVFAVLRRAGPVRGPRVAATIRPDRVPTSLLLLGALFVGYGVGRLVVLPTGELISGALAVLLALVGYGIELAWASVRRAWVPIVSAAAGAGLGALAVSIVARLPLPETFSSSLAFGWYSLAGPLVGARLGASVGLLAFLANFLREALTMVLAPYVGRRMRGEGLAALGGATALDTTLYFVVRYGDPDAGPLALASGLTLTIAASLLVPLVLAL